MSTDPRIEELDDLITETIKDVGLGPVYASRIRRAVGNAYFMVPRAELPKTDVVHGGYGKLIEVRDSQRGRWSVTDSPEHVRKIGLEYLAAAEAITAHQASAKAAEAEDAKRLDEEARELRDVWRKAGGSSTTWDDLDDGTKARWLASARKARELHKAKGN